MTAMQSLKGKGSRRSRTGTALMELGLGMPLLLMFLFGAADFGRAFYVAIEVTNAAAAGALYGSLSVANLTDTAGISNAATTDAANISGLSVSSSKVCQDSNGNSIDCATAGAYQYASVTATKTFQTLVRYPRIPSSISISKRVMMRAK